MKTPELYMLDPSGAGYRFHGCAAGKGANAAKTELEKILNRAGSEGVSCRQAVTELGKMCVLSLQCKFVVAFYCPVRLS
jgi:20S proteasome subunit alpha 7